MEQFYCWYYQSNTKVTIQGKPTEITLISRCQELFMIKLKTSYWVATEVHMLCLQWDSHALFARCIIISCGEDVLLPNLRTHCTSLQRLGLFVHWIWSQSHLRFFQVLNCTYFLKYSAPKWGFCSYFVYPNQKVKKWKKWASVPRQCSNCVEVTPPPFTPIWL